MKTLNDVLAAPAIKTETASIPVFINSLYELLKISHNTELYEFLRYFPSGDYHRDFYFKRENPKAVLVQPWSFEQTLKNAGYDKLKFELIDNDTNLQRVTWADRPFMLICKTAFLNDTRVFCREILKQCLDELTYFLPYVEFSTIADVESSRQELSDWLTMIPCKSPTKIKKLTVSHWIVTKD